MTETLTEFSDVADKNNFAVAYPNGIHKVWRYWDDEDPGFIVAIADALINERIADRDTDLVRQTFSNHFRGWCVQRFVIGLNRHIMINFRAAHDEDVPDARTEG